MYVYSIFWWGKKLNWKNLEVGSCGSHYLYFWWFKNNPWLDMNYVKLYIVTYKIFIYTLKFVIVTNFGATGSIISRQKCWSALPQNSLFMPRAFSSYHEYLFQFFRIKIFWKQVHPILCYLLPYVTRYCMRIQPIFFQYKCTKMPLW